MTNQKSKKYIFFILFFVLAFASASFSQPYLQQPDNNPSLLNYYKSLPETNSLKSLKSADTLELPFFDDFAKVMVYPDSNLWLDNFAYVNNSLGINPPSMGVATLDAVSFDGSIYEGSNTTSFEADYLTSKPINLDIPAPLDTTIFFSFFYQPQGKCDVPEAKDSLVLEFYMPKDSVWISVWRAAGTENTAFKQVIIHITDTNYLQKGFQFRFKNYASLANSTLYPGHKGNVDFWHIDWVYLNKYRTAADTILNDVAMIDPLKSFLSTYEAMPWSHYKWYQELADNATAEIKFKNNDTIANNVTLYYKCNNTRDNSQTYFYNAGSIPDVNANSVISHSHTLSSNPFPIDYENSAEFLVKSYLSYDTISLTKPYRWNDTIRYYQTFQNYYAYDDGSSENGFGIDGQQTSNSKVAYKFQTYRTDTLRAVQMYFNQTFNDVSKVYFYLTIWKDNNGVPGEIIYKKPGYRPVYEDSLNQYHTYILDTTIILSGNFYVGWTQTVEMFINVGFDLNRDASSKGFYNIYGVWQPIPFEGAMMIRPIFGAALNKKQNATEEKEVEFKIITYPNPAKDEIQFKLDESQKEEFESITIYDLFGKTHYYELGYKEKISTDNIPSGIYVIKVTDIKGKNYYNKIVIAK